MNGANLEVHEHHYIAGPRSRGGASKFEHSHEGGHMPHVHEDGENETGPAARTIDKDDWFRATGLRGGGRKRFTKKPIGPQLPTIETEPSRIDVIIVGDGGASVAGESGGGADLTLARMKLATDSRIASVTHVGPGGFERQRRTT